MSMPFDYPNRPHVRKHGPHGYVRYESFKEWLRDEFSFRCVYFLERERWYPNGAAACGVDHVRPMGDPAYAHLVCEYGNLVYACNSCNAAKSDKLVLDPYAVGFVDHLRVGPDGDIEGMTPEGTRLIDILGLDRIGPTSERYKRLRLVSLYRRYPDDQDVRALYFGAFGFPDDLPDLDSLNPGGNTNPSGIERSYRRRRDDRTLPDVY